MPCLLYCVVLTSAESISGITGVSDQPVLVRDTGGLRIYWSEVANPETLVAGPASKAAEQKYLAVQRDIITRTTAISFPFPAVVADLDSIDAVIAEHREYYLEALTRLADTVQYDLTATWSADDQADLATPISGRDYLKRRQESESRIAAIDAKLKSIAAGIVREWRTRQDRRKHLWFALIARDDRERFIAALRSAGPSEGVRLRLSGPWPPSEFVRRNSESR